KRKKKRRAERASVPPELGPELDEQGRYRPGFVRSFPADPELEALVLAFEAGNYARVRSEAPALAARTQDPEVRDAALELRRRIDPDPLLRYLLVLSFGLLAFLTLYVYSKP
ncbi:MAG TPA: hypothetical protein VK524_15120, partial [Polyangiaceae bacterium]|nr:hypothetical protein [Polyangiaceae bacterium]